MYYERLVEYQKKVAKCEYLINILEWELRTSSPIDANDYISKIINEIELELFKLKTSSEYKKLLDDYLMSTEVNNHSTEINRYYERFRKKYELRIKVPKSFTKNIQN